MKLPEPPATETCNWPSEQFAIRELSAAFVTVKLELSSIVTGPELATRVAHNVSVTVSVYWPGGKLNISWVLYELPFELVHPKVKFV